MFTLLLLIIMLYIKNNYFLYTSDGYIFSYLIALALPVLLLVIFAFIIIYQRYLLKLGDSHRSIYIWLTSLLVLVSVSIVAFAVVISFYYQSPKEYRDFAYFSVIPYYVALFTVAGFFIYISPGLLDKVNGIPGNHFFLIAMYLIFWALYPIVYLVSVMNKSKELDNKEEVEGEAEGGKKEHQYLN